MFQIPSVHPPAIFLHLLLAFPGSSFIFPLPLLSQMLPLLLWVSLPHRTSFISSSLCRLVTLENSPAITPELLRIFPNMSALLGELAVCARACVCVCVCLCLSSCLKCFMCIYTTYSLLLVCVCVARCIMKHLAEFQWLLIPEDPDLILLSTSWGPQSLLLFYLTPLALMLMLHIVQHHYCQNEPVPGIVTGSVTAINFNVPPSDLIRQATSNFVCLLNMQISM